MKRLSIIALALIISLGVSSKAHAVLLYDEQIFSLTTDAFSAEIATMSIRYDDFTLLSIAFDGTDTNNIGDTAMFLPGNITFHNFVSFLTNGSDDSLTRFVALDSGFSIDTPDESALFGLDADSLNSIDFAGYGITKLQITVDNIVRGAPFNANHSEIYGSFQIYGERHKDNVVPEPASMIIFGSGLSGAAFVRRRKA